ncbi:MAG: NAD(P)/FAD-dependent oxidoreductase [Candidatus Campbellbacteria bacterium]|nr:NAD(P)/FAD-dependent oxidoreductase [Candidatus Campbellbacteria bacterium]
MALMDAKTPWDVIVIGGGPSGMMAAGTAAQNSAKVLLIEKNGKLGEKLLITGGGRCNVTNSEFDTRKFLEKFKENGKFLFSAFAQWGVKETLDFFHTRGMPTKVEAELRTFPTSNSAQSVWGVLVKNIQKHNVEILSNSPVTDIVREDGNIVGVQLQSKKIVRGKSIIIATGGTSRPETGSTGDAYAWLQKIGHTVVLPTPSLVPVALKDVWVKKLAGITLSDIKITVFQNEKKYFIAKGKILFTHVGISGPTVLNMSKDIGELLKYGDGEVVCALDLLPTHDYGKLNTALQELFKEHDKKKFQNALSNLIPKALVPIIIELGGFNGETHCNSITREERLKLVKTLKHIPLHVKKLLGTEKAIITSGGVVLDEIDFKTMRSRLFPNLYIIGDMLDVDRPSGGYSLQLCWTTGFVAGLSASKQA